jgi:tetratricopeptide (TPR) repeat protein
LKVFEGSQGTNSDRTAIALNSLAKVYINQGKYSKAQSLCRRALDIFESIFDKYHPNVADVLETLVQLHRETGNMAEVAALEQRVEEIRVRKLVSYAPIAKAIE